MCIDRTVRTSWMSISGNVVLTCICCASTFCTANQKRFIATKIEMKSNGGNEEGILKCKADAIFFKREIIGQSVFILFLFDIYITLTMFTLCIFTINNRWFTFAVKRANTLLNTYCTCMVVNFMSLSKILQRCQN